MTFWTKIAGFILRNRYLVLLTIALITGFLVTQTKHMRFSYTEANLLPTDHEANIEYNKFLEIFGEEGNLVILGVKDSTIFTPAKFNAWNKLVKDLDSLPQVDFTVSVADVQQLKADRKQRKFVIEPLFDKAPTTNEEVTEIKNQLFEKLPFYNNLLYNDKGVLQTAIYLNKDIVNTPVRKDFVMDLLIPTVESFEKKHSVDVRISGMPYIRTLNSRILQMKWEFL